MGDRPNITETSSASATHISLLQQIIDTSCVASDSLVYSYHKSFNGFAAWLTHSQHLKLYGYEGIVSVFPSQKKKLHTTRSWDFLGFPQNVTRTTVESDVIIGMLDTGIWPESQSFNDSGVWPESESFSDEGFGPPPQKWKGGCIKSENFTCNNKIIGAKYYRITKNFTSDVASPRDTEGHGSHTASTAAGNFVPKASLEGLGFGTARGGVPSARIAVYKVCWASGCSDADVLAAFDDAIADGVDIISMSLGGTEPRSYFTDSIAIGTFHAMQRGILTSTSAGNAGPKSKSVYNVAPWLLSVAASSIDRKFITKVQLGNGASYEGVSINTVDLYPTMYPIIYGGLAPKMNRPNVTAARQCLKGSLEKRLVRGKLVLCDLVGSGESVFAAGGKGAIMQDRSYNDVAFNYVVPAAHFGQDVGSKISAYLKQTKNPKATIFKTVEKKSEDPPIVADFSSRGPNTILPDLLKPDIAAPGVDILAAYSEAATATGLAGDKRVVSYNILSGTSMACPHATGAAAYIKSFHPKWSPAALRSALMTTATPMKSANNPEEEFAYGSGLINLDRVADPGLIYDAREHDYIELLCGQGYNDTEMKLITGEHVGCSEVDKSKSSVWNLNYPSFTISGKPGTVVKRVFHRTVTNVGNAHSKYKAKIKSSDELKIKVQPKVLHFKSVGKKLSFRVTVKVKLKQSGMISGTLIWSDESHEVRSPIVAHTLL
ncbi:unnamed protein product [Linum perenne]